MPKIQTLCTLTHKHLTFIHSLTHWKQNNKRKSSVSVFTDSISFYMNSLLWKIIWNRKWIAQPFFRGCSFSLCVSLSFFLSFPSKTISHTHVQTVSCTHCCLFFRLLFTWASWFRTPLFWNNLSWIDSHILTKQTDRERHTNDRLNIVLEKLHNEKKIEIAGLSIR